MKRFSLSNILFYIPIILLVIVSIIIPLKHYSTYTYLLKPLFWLIYSIVCYFLLSNKKGRYKYKKEKTKTVIIFTLLYLIIWFLLGLVFGYTANVYSQSFFKILRNFWAFILIIVFKEYVRMKLLESNHSTTNIIFITIIFFISDLSIHTLYVNLLSRELAFKYLAGVIFPLLVKNVLLTYLIFVGGLKCGLSYTLFITAAEIILPIVPNLDWFFQALTSSIISAIIGVMVYREHHDKVLRDTKRIKEESLFIVSCELILVIILALFVAGVFKYQPIAILTYSMEPIFTRGDAVIVEKVKSDHEKEKIKVNDIIQYKLNNYSVVHRVVKIQEDSKGNRIYTTKGDNNSSIDFSKVKDDQIVGVVKAYIPKVGYPSVWLSEFFDEKNKNVDVDT